MLENVARSLLLNREQSLALFQRDNKWIIGVVNTNKDPVTTSHEDVCDDKENGEKRYLYRAAFNGRNAFETKN